MKTIIQITLPILVVAASATPLLAQSGGGFEITWSTIDGGGGGCTAGVYALTGTIGQPDAGKMSGGVYSLDGGFWGILGTVQIPGVLLRIERTTTNTVVIAWSTSAVGLSLVQSASPSPSNWSTMTNTVAVVGAENQVIVSPPSGNRFYRLVAQ